MGKRERREKWLGLRNYASEGLSCYNFDRMIYSVVEKLERLLVPPFHSIPGLGRRLSLRIPPHGRAGRCHGLARGAPLSPYVFRQGNLISDTGFRSHFERDGEAIFLNIDLMAVGPPGELL